MSLIEGATGTIAAFGVEHTLNKTVATVNEHIIVPKMDRQTSEELLSVLLQQNATHIKQKNKAQNNNYNTARAKLIFLFLLCQQPYRLSVIFVNLHIIYRINYTHIHATLARPFFVFFWTFSHFFQKRLLIYQKLSKKQIL